MQYTVVKKDDEDIFDDKITSDSPIALKVAQAHKNDLIHIETKYSKVEYKLLKII